MNDLEDRISAALRANAERSGPFEGLERQAVPRATRIRRHRRIAGVAVAAALVAVVSLGVKVVPELPVNGIQPVGPGDSIEGKTVELPTDLGMLPLGDAPKVPWYDGEYIHDGSKRVRVGEYSEVLFGRISGGYWVQRGSAQSAITLIDADGRTIGDLTASPVSWPVVSTNGQRLAWTEDDGTAFLADAGGTELKRQHIGEGVEPIGFLGRKVLLGAELGAMLWDPSSGSVENLVLDTPASNNTTDGRDLVPVRVGETCVAMYSFTRQKTLWERCGDQSLDGLSGDGRYTILDGNSAFTAAVLDARTGRTLLSIENITASPVVWGSEPGGAVLIESEWNGRKAIVRCDVETSRCELATELTPAAEDERVPSLTSN